MVCPTCKKKKKSQSQVEMLFVSHDLFYSIFYFIYFYELYYSINESCEKKHVKINVHVWREASKMYTFHMWNHVIIINKWSLFNVSVRINAQSPEMLFLWRIKKEYHCLIFLKCCILSVCNSLSWNTVLFSF